MQGLGQILAASLFVLSFLGVLADKTDEHPSQLGKRSAESWTGATADAGPAAVEKRFSEFVGKRASALDDPLADKRYEFVGKRGPYEFVGKRPYEFVGKRIYEFLGKRGPYEFVGKRMPYEFVGKRPAAGFLASFPVAPLQEMDKRTMVDIYGKRVELPYEFVGKRIFGTTAVERLSAEEDISELMARAAESGNDENQPQGGDVTSGQLQAAGRSKRYSEWLGKRSSSGRSPNGQALTDQLLRDLVNKRISAMVRNRLHYEASPEFVGRREDEEDGDETETARSDGLEKRYAEFLG